MARMIPVFMDERTPPGERDVFAQLAAGPDDWVVMHALDLAPWNRGLRTEVDFLVVVPDTGILCIEVKSHPDLSFDGTRWYPASITRSPFKQAGDASHTFRRRLADLLPQLRRVPVVHCCIFPRARFELTANVSVAPWELIDRRAFDGFENAAVFCADLKRRIAQAVAADARLTPLRSTLERGELQNIIQCCVPVQKHHPDAREEVRERERALEGLLRQQQKPVLRLASRNASCVVFGGAGTGKTLIAMALARQLAQDGRRVALLCFNHLISEWMRRQITAQTPPLPNLIVGSAIRVLAEMAGIVIPPDPAASFWDTTLPQQIEERLTDPDFRAMAEMDYLVLDEAQDLLARPTLWQALTHFLRGGVEHGTFALFGDFEHQVLSDRARMRETLQSVLAQSRATQWPLTENCRNYRIVGQTAVQLAGVDPAVYSEYLRPGGSIDNYDIAFYEQDREQLDLIATLLREFRAQGYQPGDIVLLSFRSDEASAAVRLRKAGYRLRPARQAGHETAFASIHAFKGLESKVVILTDMYPGEQDFHRDLFYTGLTRATELARVLCDRRSQVTLRRWLAGEDAA